MTSRAACRACSVAAALAVEQAGAWSCCVRESDWERLGPRTYPRVRSVYVDTSHRVDVYVLQSYTCTCAQTKDPPEIQPDRGRESATPSRDPRTTPRATARDEDEDEIARRTGAGYIGEHASARHHDARVARPQPRRGRSAGSNASPSDETRRRSLVSRMGISPDLILPTCMPVAPTSPAGALREIWPRSHLWLARLGLSRWACSCRCAWPTRGCLRP